MTAGAAVAATNRRRRPRSRPEADAGDPRQRLTIVAPSPPSPRSPGRADSHQWVRRHGLADRVAQRPGAQAVDDQDRGQSGQGRVVEVATERLERLLDAGSAQVQRRRHGASPIEPQRRRVRAAAATGGLERRMPAEAGSRSSRSTATRIPPGLERRAPAVMVHRGDATLPAARPAAGPVADLPQAGF